MTTIFKYPLAITDDQRVRMPYGAEILCVMFQRDTLCLWAKCDPSHELSSRRITIIGTGHPLSDTNMKYIGSAVSEGGDFVWHVFENYLL